MSTKEYLKVISPPLLHDIEKHNVIPLLGSGFSRNAQGLPRGRKMPLWKDLGEQFAKLQQGYQYDGNPTNAISRFVKSHGKTRLAEYLREFLYVQEAKPGAAHHYFTRLPFDLVITTNFDKLIEYAYLNKGFTPHVIHEAKDLPQNVQAKPKIIKIHGDLDHADSIIITRKDYRSAKKGDRGFSDTLKHWLTTKTFLFIGYSITDPDFRHLLALVKKNLGELKRPAYTIVVDPSKEECARYSKLRIVPVPLPGDKKNYDTILSTVLKQMALYFNPPQEQGSLEVVSNLAEIQSHSAKDLIVSAGIKNKTLYKVLFEFMKEASAKISDVLNAIQKAKKYHRGDNSTIKYFPLEQQFALYDTLEYVIEGNRSELETVSSYNRCKEIMDHDLRISEHVNRYHNLLGLLQRMSHWTYVAHIFKRMIYTYIDTNTLDLQLFMRLYLDLEYFFIHDYLNYVEISPMFNISLTGADHIELSERLSIRKISNREQLILRKTSEWICSGEYRFEQAKYVVEYKFTMRKGFGNEDRGDHPSNIDSIFSSVVAALRLFQRGNVGIYSQHKLVQLDIPLYPYNVSLGTFALGISIGEYYILGDNQITRFREFWNQYNDLLINKILDYKRYEQDKYSNIKVAMENFLRAYARTDDDKYTDFMKSLMAIMLLDSEVQKDNVEHITARRCSVLLEVDPSKRREVEKEVKSLFKVSNQIITGRYLEQINIVKLRDYVAKCIIRYMDAMKSNSFSHDSFIGSLGP